MAADCTEKVSLASQSIYLRDGILYKASLHFLVVLRRAQAQPCGWIA
jgi:hypothetical protein